MEPALIGKTAMVTSALMGAVLRPLAVIQIEIVGRLLDFCAVLMVNVVPLKISVNLMQIACRVIVVFLASAFQLRQMNVSLIRRVMTG